MQLNKGLKLLNVLILSTILFRCINGNDYLSTEKLVDDYYLYKYSEKLYKVECKLGCDSDKSIEGNIKKIWLDSRVMLIEIAPSENHVHYYLIISNKKDLKCCNNNFLFEAQSISKIDSVLGHNNLSRKSLRLEFSDKH